MEKKLKILLVDSAFSTKGSSEAQGEMLSNTVVPLSVGYIGSYIKNQIPTIDLKILKASEEIINFIKNEKPDIIGFCNYLWNTNLSISLSNFSKKINPKTYIVFGGPEINTKPVNKDNFIKKYSHVDMLVHHEGEVAFTKLIKIFIEEEGNKKNIRSRIKELGNCFYIDQEKNFKVGPAEKRIGNLADIPSPYLMGLFDHFLQKGCYVPLIQTNRGCPYQCTFCQEGSDYYSKIHFHSLNNVKRELDYIATRVNPAMGLYIVDSNLGMYKQDLEIAYHIRDLKKKFNWPMHVNSSTGKSQLTRIKKFAEILDGSLRISNAVQSMNDNVLDAIKRTNAATLKEFLKGLKMVSVPDIILPLPKETKETFINGLNILLNTKSPIRFTVFPALLLSDTEMNDKGEVKEHGLKVKYRQHQNLVSKVGGEWVCETERNIIETSTMSQQDVFEARKYVVMMDAMLREEPFKEIFYYLDSNEIKRSELTMSMYNNLDKAPQNIQNCLNEYVEKIISETFDTEDEVLEYMKKYGDEYRYGIKGGDLLRYAQKLWIDHFHDLLNWIAEHLEKVLQNNGYKDKKSEIKNLKSYYEYLYFDRLNAKNKKSKVKRDFDFDIVLWMENVPYKKLSEFKNNVKYTFASTNFSKLSNTHLWNSFGFNLNKNSDYKFIPQFRMYMSKTRREIKRDDNIKVKQELPLMAKFAKNVGLSK
jgi:hypothetical protein